MPMPATKWPAAEGGQPAKPIFQVQGRPLEGVPSSPGTLLGNIMNMLDVANSVKGMFGGGQTGNPFGVGQPTGGGGGGGPMGPPGISSGVEAMGPQTLGVEPLFAPGLSAPATEAAIGAAAPALAGAAGAGGAGAGLAAAAPVLAGTGAATAGAAGAGTSLASLLALLAA